MVFGFMGALFGRLGIAAPKRADPHPGSNLLLRDNSSNLLLRDNSSALLLGH